MFIYFWETETESKQRRDRERGRHRIPSRLQAPSCQHRARRGARTHEPWDHDLKGSRRSTNWTTEAPLVSLYINQFSVVCIFYNRFIFHYNSPVLSRHWMLLKSEFWAKRKTLVLLVHSFSQRKFVVWFLGIGGIGIADWDRRWTPPRRVLVLGLALLVVVSPESGYLSEL